MLNVSYIPFPTLETERFMLVKPSKEHYEPMFELRTDGEVMKHIYRPKARSISDIQVMFQSMEENVERGTGIFWIIEEKVTRRVCGYIGFFRSIPANHRAEVGYALLPMYFGQGIASESLKEVLRFAFEDKKFHSVEADIAPENDASRRLLERFGFVKEAYFKENFYFEGAFLDSEIYTLLSQNYKA